MQFFSTASPGRGLEVASVAYLPGARQHVSEKETGSLIEWGY